MKPTIKMLEIKIGTSEHLNSFKSKTDYIMDRIEESGYDPANVIRLREYYLNQYQIVEVIISIPDPDPAPAASTPPSSPSKPDTEQSNRTPGVFLVRRPRGLLYGTSDTPNQTRDNSGKSDISDAPDYEEPSRPRPATFQRPYP